MSATSSSTVTLVDAVPDSFPKIAKVYWSRRPEHEPDPSDEPLFFFGGARSRRTTALEEHDAVYLHVVVEQLFLDTGVGQVAYPVRLFVDLVAFEAEMLRGNRPDEALEFPVDAVPGSATLEIEIADAKDYGSNSVQVRLDGGVLHVAESSVTHVAAGPDERGRLRRYDVSFELKLTPDQLKALTQQAYDNYRLVAWAWLHNEHIQQAYEANRRAYAIHLDPPAQADAPEGDGAPFSFLDGFDRAAFDRELRRQRYTAVADGTARATDQAIQQIAQRHRRAANTPVDLSTREGRLDYLHQTGAFVRLWQGRMADTLLDYHERSTNAIEVSLFAPVEEMALGVQPGPVGLCADASGDAFPAWATETDTARDGNPWASGPYGPQATELSGLREPLFFFRAHSAAEWLNSVERVVAPGGVPMGQPTGTVLLRRGELPFEAGSVLGRVGLRLAACDEEGRRSSEAHAALDLGAAASICIPEARLCDVHGRPLVTLGKGFPTDATALRFTERTHAQAWLTGFDEGPTWHTHPYAHRPIVVRYRLEADLTATQVARWNQAPPVVWFGGDLTLPPALTVTTTADGACVVQSTGGTVGFPLRIEAAQATAGDHLVLLYVQTYPLPPKSLLSGDEHHHTVRVRLDSGGGFVSPAFGALALDAPLSQAETFPTYRLRADDRFAETAEAPEGPFAQTCVASLDLLSHAEVRANAQEEGYALFRRAQGRAIGGLGQFLLDLLPGWAGSLAGAAWHLAVELAYTGDASVRQRSRFAEQIVNAYAETALKAGGVVMGADALKRAAKHAGSGLRLRERYRSARAEAEAHVGRYASPMRRGRAFGELPGDLLLQVHAHGLVRTLPPRLRWSYGYERTPAPVQPPEVASVEVRPRQVLALFAREVDLGGEGPTPPFLFVAGAGGGFLEAPFEDGAPAAPGRTLDLGAQVETAERVASHLRHSGLGGMTAFFDQLGAANPLDAFDPSTLPAVPRLALPDDVGAALGRLVGTGQAGDEPERVRQHVLAPHVDRYLDRAWAFAEALGLNAPARGDGGGPADGEPAAAYLAHLAEVAERIGRGAVSGIVSAPFAAFFRERAHVAATLAAWGRGERPRLGEREAVDVGVAVAVLGHVASSELRCPACRAVMNWNWGWCPYHATPASLRAGSPQQGIPSADTDDDGVVTKGEFVRFIYGPDGRDRGIAGHLNDVPASDKAQRLFVHFTEFRARRRSLADEDG